MIATVLKKSWIRNGVNKKEFGKDATESPYPGAELDQVEERNFILYQKKREGERE